MKFIKDKEVGYRLDIPSPSQMAVLEQELFSIVAEQYYDEKKELGYTDFTEGVDATVEAILNGKYSAWIDQWADGEDVFHIEVDYGLGNIDIGLSGVII